MALCKWTKATEDDGTPLLIVALCAGLSACSLLSHHVARFLVVAFGVVPVDSSKSKQTKACRHFGVVSESSAIVAGLICAK
jgi:hypothetical protein